MRMAIFAALLAGAVGQFYIGGCATAEDCRIYGDLQATCVLVRNGDGTTDKVCQCGGNAAPPTTLAPTPPPTTTTTQAPPATTTEGSATTTTTDGSATTTTDGSATTTTDGSATTTTDGSATTTTDGSATTTTDGSATTTTDGSATTTTDGSATTTTDGSATTTTDGSATTTTDGSATTSEGSATTSEGSATTSEGSATTSEGSATTSEGSATTSEGSATTSEGSATTTTTAGPTTTTAGPTTTTAGPTTTTAGPTTTTAGPTSSRVAKVVGGLCVAPEREVAQVDVYFAFDIVFAAPCVTVTADLSRRMQSALRLAFGASSDPALAFTCGSLGVSGSALVRGSRLESLGNSAQAAVAARVNADTELRKTFGAPSSTTISTGRVCAIPNAITSVQAVDGTCFVFLCSSGYQPTNGYRSCAVVTRSHDDDDLTDAEKAGIGLGVSFFVILVVVIAFLCLRGKEDAAAGSGKDTEPAAGGV